METHQGGRHFWQHAFEACYVRQCKNCKVYATSGAVLLTLYSDTGWGSLVL